MRQLFIGISLTAGRLRCSGCDPERCSTARVAWSVQRAPAVEPSVAEVEAVEVDQFDVATLCGCTLQVAAK